MKISTELLQKKCRKQRVARILKVSHQSVLLLGSYLSFVQLVSPQTCTFAFDIFYSYQLSDDSSLTFGRNQYKDIFLISTHWVYMYIYIYIISVHTSSLSENNRYIYIENNKETQNFMLTNSAD
jgi:hypothetical protein